MFSLWCTLPSYRRCTWARKTQAYRYSSLNNRVVLGLNSLQWYDISKRDSRPTPDLTAHPSQRNHRFFDSKGPGGVITPRPSTSTLDVHGGQDLEIDKDHILQYAHYGYVYCMLLAKDVNGRDLSEESLISGGGDGVIKIWTLDRKTGEIDRNPLSLENGDDSILTIALDGTLLYSGRLDGDINVWDLDTCQLIRRVKAHRADVLTLAIGHGLIFTGGANGFAKVSSLIMYSFNLLTRLVRNSIRVTNVSRDGRRMIGLFSLQQLPATTEKQYMSQEETMTASQFGMWTIVSNTHIHRQ